jgi:GntR family transcriptional regulator/MocR family aminotransferase
VGAQDAAGCVAGNGYEFEGDVVGGQAIPVQAHQGAQRMAFDQRVQDLEALLGVLACGPSDAGLDVCVGLTNRLGEGEAAARALAGGVEVRPLSYYAHPAAGPDCAMPPGLLLGFSAFTPEQIRAGVARLEQALL